MNPERQSYYRDKLNHLMAEIRSDLEQSGEASETVALDTSIGRLSRMDALQSQQMALELRRRQQNQLLRVENALKRIEKGSYGRCGRCGKSIPEDRLEIQPDAVSCLACASSR